MSFLSHDDKFAVLTETPGLSEAVTAVLEEGAMMDYLIKSVNDILEAYGFNRFASYDLLREVFDKDLQRTGPYFSNEEIRRAFTGYEYGDFDPDNITIALVDNECGKHAPSKEEHATVSIKKVTYINGLDCDSMSMEDFLSAIKKADAEIKRLTDMDVDSSTVSAKIESLKADRKELVELLDAKHGSSED